jgi:3-oxoacyl-[acyl-carrier-protein] synthase-3/clorobiocin biosynthesis protein CloN2
VRTPDTYITGLGSCVPATVAVADAVADGRYPAEDAALHGLTAVAVAGDVPAPELGLRAARAALERAGQDAELVSLLLYATSWHQGPDGWPPQHHLQRQLGLDRALAMELRHGCNGMFSAFELAASHLAAGPVDEAALLVAADNFSTPMVDRWRMGPGYLAGDGASALVLGRRGGFARLLSTCTTAVAEAEEVHRCGEPLFPPGPTLGRGLNFSDRTAVFNRRAGAGFGTSVWMTVHQQLVTVAGRALAEAGIELGQVARAAFMHYSREIVEHRGMGAIGLPMSRSTFDFGRTVGHLGSSDHIVALEHLLDTGELRPGELVLLASIGPGITISSAVVRLLEPPPWL